jgi:hypothetical protein
MPNVTDEKLSKFQETVRIKLEISELKYKFDELKDYWKGVAAEELTDGVGELEIFDGKGIRFSKKKSSISGPKLIAQGVDKDKILAATGEYVAFEIFG